MAKARRAALKRMGLSCLLGLVLCPTPLLLAQQKSADEWEVLEGCRLITNANAIVDGDSFRVAHNDREYIFRLYFVDAPESDATLKERTQDQAAYFGISPNDVPRAGALASQFTREILTGAEFTVITRWRNAMGRSSLARFYAVVLVTARTSPRNWSPTDTPASTASGPTGRMDRARPPSSINSKTSNSPRANRNAAPGMKPNSLARPNPPQSA